jgi:hypothetical protein
MTIFTANAIADIIPSESLRYHEQDGRARVNRADGATGMSLGATEFFLLATQLVTLEDAIRGPLRQEGSARTETDLSQAERSNIHSPAKSRSRSRLHPCLR